MIEIRYRDKQFAVISANASDNPDRTLSISGEMGSLVEGMPFVGEIQERSDRRNIAYGEAWKALSVVSSEPLWRRLAGVTMLQKTFGNDLPMEIVTHLLALRDALSNPEKGEPERAENPLCRAAETLGLADVDWLVPLSYAICGNDGPILAASNPGWFLKQGVVNADSVLAIAVHHTGVSLSADDRIDCATTLIERELIKVGKPALSIQKVTPLIQPAFDVTAEDLGSIALRLGSYLSLSSIAQQADWLFSHIDDLLADAASRPLPHLARKTSLGTSAAAIWQALSEESVVAVTTPTGSSHAWYQELASSLPAGAVLVDHADLRGSLNAGGYYGDRCERPVIVAFADCHRRSFDRLASDLLEVPPNARVLLLGDDWLWPPGTASGSYADIVKHLRSDRPQLVLPGSGPAWGLRQGHDIAHHPAIHYETTAGEGVVRIRFGEPGATPTKVGGRVMLVARLGGYDTGTLAEVSEVNNRQVSAIHVDGGPTLAIDSHQRSMIASGEYIPLGWLSGVHVQRLAVTTKVHTLRDLYAILSAAEQVWVAGRDLIRDLSEEIHRGLSWYMSANNKAGSKIVKG